MSDCTEAAALRREVKRRDQIINILMRRAGLDEILIPGGEVAMSFKAQVERVSLRDEWRVRAENMDPADSRYRKCDCDLCVAVREQR